MNGLIDLPTEITKWYEYTARLDNQWRADQEIGGPTRTPEYRNKDRSSFTKRTETVSVSAMTDQQRAEHMQKGLCFFCHQTGHLAKDCPQKPRKSFGRKPFTPPNYFYYSNRTQGNERRRRLYEDTCHVQEPRQ